MPHCQASLPIAAFGLPPRLPKTSDMPRQVLAANLRALMNHREPPWGNRELARKAEIDPKTVARILDGSHAATIDTIAALGAVFELLPWQMLVPGLMPEDKPMTQLSQAEAELYTRLKRLATDFGKLSDH